MESGGGGLLLRVEVQMHSSGYLLSYEFEGDILFCGRAWIPATVENARLKKMYFELRQIAEVKAHGEQRSNADCKRHLPPTKR